MIELELNLHKIYNSKAYLDKVGLTIGKYKLLNLIDCNSRSHSKIFYNVKCIKCGWVGITNYRTILRSSNHEIKKCSHIGSSSIHKDDVYGKYIVIKKAPSKLCANNILIPYYKCLCTKCGKIVNVSLATLYATKNRRMYIDAKCKHK